MVENAHINYESVSIHNEIAFRATFLTEKVENAYILNKIMHHLKIDSVIMGEVSRREQ